MKTVLTIAGFDPSSGAGITADLMVFAAYGLFGTSCITALTVQSTQGVFATHPVPSDVLQNTLNCLLEDLPPAGIKIGMLANEANVASVVTFLSKLRQRSPPIPVVLDPVLRSSSGRELLDPAGVSRLRTHLLPLIDWITPNLAEVAALAEMPVMSHSEIMAAAQAIQNQMDKSNTLTKTINVIVTQGHRNPPNDLLLTTVPLAEPIWIPGQHIPSTSTHGTGCAFSSALLSRLVLGDAPLAAAIAAKRYVAEAIRTATSRGSGKGPLNHLWPLKPASKR